MKRGEKGYTLLELLIAITIMVVASGAAGAVIFQIFKNADRNNDYMTAVRRIQDAGYWISHDAQMARGATIDNLTSPDFLILRWTEWDADGDPIYHSARYFFEELTDGIGKLQRNHWSSAGANEVTRIAQYIYYDPDDTEHTTKVSYENMVLTVRLTSICRDIMETREYRIKHRPNF